MPRVRLLGHDGPALGRLSVGFVIGAVVAVATGLTVGWAYAPALGWFVIAMVFVLSTWLSVRRFGARETRRHATREDPTRQLTRVILVVASLASLGGVGFLLIGAQQGEATLAASVGIASVAASWLLVHTLYTLRYAELYYAASPPGGIDFNQDEQPVYGDFAYLAFTLGMTYQVSDTDLKTRSIRGTALHHALLSYLLGAIVLAVVVNLIAGLGGSSH